LTEDWLEELHDLLADRLIDLDEVFHRIIGKATAMVGADRGTLYLVDRARNQLISRVADLPEVAEIRLNIGEGVAGRVVETCEPVRVPKGLTSDASRRMDQVTGYHTESMVAVPVVDTSGRVVAVVQLLNKHDGDFDEDDEADLVELAASIAELLLASSLRSQILPHQHQPLAFRFNNIIGESSVMQQLYELTARAASTEATVLVRGESGSGKELIARAIHDNSSRRKRPMVKVDCAALPEQLIENELFGHERGAFTGADRPATGKVDAAEGGTLFLDEIGELPLGVQGKLLRLLQDREFIRVGGTTPIPIDVRIVCATHRNLEKAVEDEALRQDLYYRLRVVELTVPPLRSRGHADLDRLIDFFMFEMGERHGRQGMELSPAARARLHSHNWPGNVRELEHCLESAVVLSATALVAPDQICVAQLCSEGAPIVDEDAFVSSIRSLREVELDYIRHVLKVHDGNRSASARTLGIGRNTLLRKLGGSDSSET